MAGFTAVIIGAGALGRGFVAPLMARLGARVVLVDRDETLIRKLAGDIEAALYDGHGQPTTFQLHDATLYTLAEFQEHAMEVLNFDGNTVVFSACRPNPYPELARRWPHLQARWVILENVPAIMDEVRDAQEGVKFHLGLADVLAVEPLRGGIVHAEDPFMSTARLWIDDGVPLPGIGQDSPAVGVLSPDLLRARWAARFVTHNTGHAVVGFLGARTGYTLVNEAVADQQIADVVHQAMEEAKTALVASPSMLRGLAQGRVTYQMGAEVERAANHYLYTETIRYLRFQPDTIERVARDLERKLARNERLVAPFLILMEMGKDTPGLATAIRAGLDLLDMPRAEALRSICGLDPERDARAWQVLMENEP